MEIEIDGRPIGLKHPPYLVAELSANHNGCIDRAKKTIDAAMASGAEAVKLQTYTPDTMTIRCDKPDFLISGGPWDGYRLYDLYREAHTPYEWHRELFEYGKSCGITVFSTPFDETAVDLLEELDTPAYKIASFELLDLPLISYVGSTGKPIIMSTGMASEQEVTDAIRAARQSGCKDVLLLHCISSYPVPINSADVRKVSTLANQFGVGIGLSDHTLGNTAAIAAIALGACFIEKHFTISRREAGPDSSFSMEPREFQRLATSMKDAWLSLGDGSFDRTEVEAESKKFRRSIYFVKDLPAGAIVTERDIRRIRPGFGLSPGHWNDLLGKELRVAVERGTPASWDVFKDKE